MSLTNSNRIPIPWSNVDVFTFGKSSLYGYDSLNHCIIVHSSIELNNISNDDRLHLSSSPSWPIRRLILNEDETILALIADKIAYLVYLPQSNIPSKGSHLCPIVRVPPTVSLSSSNSINCSLIDFIWLTTNHFVTVNSIPSASECHLYIIRSSKQDDIERIETFSVGFSSKNKSGTPNKKISLHQPSDIIKLDKTIRNEKTIELILLFAMKTDGDIFLLEIDKNQLLSDNQISGEFQGPIRILPSTSDNYGANYSQSTFICLSNSTSSFIVFTRDKYQLNQCIILSPSLNQYYLYTIDLISLPINSNGKLILTSIIQDPFSSNRYFISDSIGNVYLIEILWIKQIQQGLKQFQSTRIQHLINGTNFNNKIINRIEQMAVIKTNNNNQQYLAVIVKSQTNQQKELILVRLQPSELNENTLSLSSSDRSDFVDHIRSVLSREQSIPYVTLSTSLTNISDSDLEKNLLQFIKILTEQYIEKQEKVRKEIENKQKYLSDFQQTQSNEWKQSIERFQKIQNQFQHLQNKYQEACNRRKRLSTNVDDILSVIEQNTPVISDAEIRMQKQLEKYQIQINYLKERFQLLQQFISSSQNQEQLENLSMENIQNYVQNHRNQIDQMKKRLETIQIQK